MKPWHLRWSAKYRQCPRVHPVTPEEARVNPTVAYPILETILNRTGRFCPTAGCTRPSRGALNVVSAPIPTILYRSYWLACRVGLLQSDNPDPIWDSCYVLAMLSPLPPGGCARSSRDASEEEREAKEGTRSQVERGKANWTLTSHEQIYFRGSHGLFSSPYVVLLHHLTYTHTYTYVHVFHTTQCTCLVHWGGE